MDTKFSKPKGFGEILDHTFSLSKSRFRDFFTILLIFMGPIYLLEAIILLLTGSSFFREVGNGSGWLEQISSGFEESTYTTDTNFGADLGIILVGIASVILFPVAEAGIIFAINHIRKNEEYTVGGVIKQAFSRFWPILGSSILFGLMIFGFVLIPILLITFMVIPVAIANPFLAVLVGVILFIGFAVGIGYLLTRWSFYFGSVVLDRESPGFSRSWRLTRKRGWSIFGLYIIFSLIIGCISFAVEVTFSIFLGNSVLLNLLVNIVNIFTTLIFSVGYAVMYLDAKTRHDGDDLKDLIEDYNSVKN